MQYRYQAVLLSYMSWNRLYSYR